ncbi:S8 family serine peptidase [Magnetovibrio sp.]|uniref:S8 family serine peptidase n=1 Tax=Magnetovibrio sp. TaxID=2024836 RepID=UPI002F95EC2D
MDSDTKTILSIVGGLGGILVLILGGLGLYNYLSQTEKPQNVATVNVDAPDATAAQNLPSATTMTASQLEAFKAFEGMRSTFSPEHAYEPGEVILAAPPAGFEDKIRPAGFHVLEHVNLGRLGLKVVRVATPTGMSVPDALKKLAILLPGVTMDANNQFEDSSSGAATAGSNPRAMAGWDNLSPNCGSGLVLGQIDSGVDMTHPALKGQHIQYQAFTKSGREPGPPDHGTAVAAMLVGSVDWGGLLPGAQLYAANMFEINEKGQKVGSAIGLMKAVDWLATQKVHAVNLSIAGGDNKVVRKAFDLAKNANLLLIAAVGNWGRSDKPAYPAAYDYVVAVTATKGAELIYSHANQGKYVDFAAPGVGIYTALAGGGGKPQTGTSFATPYITAMAAILNKAGKTPTATDLRRLLSTATTDLGKPGKDEVFGYGYVKARPACK